MNDALRMQVSAFIDGELPENETELLLRRLSQDPALRQLVAEYLSIGRAIRREREIPGLGELRGRIARSLGEEPPIDIQPASGPRRLNWMKPVAGLAIAASVAALAVVGLRSMEAPPGAARETLQAGAPAAYTQPRPEAAASRQEPSDMLMQYYLRHGETSADLGPNGILTRLVTLELRHGELQEIEPTRTTVRSTRPVDDGAGRGNEPGDGADDDDNDNDD
jgi:sigma-E factor negative regulatory protein RseA